MRTSSKSTLSSEMFLAKREQVTCNIFLRPYSLYEAVRIPSWSAMNARIFCTSVGFSKRNSCKVSRCSSLTLLISGSILMRTDSSSAVLETTSFQQSQYHLEERVRTYSLRYVILHGIWGNTFFPAENVERTVKTSYTPINVHVIIAIYFWSTCKLTPLIATVSIKSLRVCFTWVYKVFTCNYCLHFIVMYKKIVTILNVINDTSSQEINETTKAMFVTWKPWNEMQCLANLKCLSSDNSANI